MKISRNAKSPKRGQQRRRVVPLWRSRKVRGTLIALLVVLAAGGGWRMWQSGWVPGAIDKAKWKMIALSSDLGFKVDEILVIGRRETAQKDLLAAVRLSRGAPILAFEPSGLLTMAQVYRIAWFLRLAKMRRRTFSSALAIKLGE